MESKKKLTTVINNDRRWKITYWMYFVGFLDLFSVSMIVPLVGREAIQRGASSTLAGLISSTYGALQFISGPLIGYWSDLVDRKFVFLVCLLVSSIGYAMPGMSSSIFILFLARFPPGIFKHSMTISKTYLADVTPRAEQGKVFGHYSAFSSIGFIIGPAIAGHLLGNSGFNYICYLTGIFFTIQFVIVWLFLPSIEKSRQRATRNQLFSISSWVKDIKEVNWINHWDLFTIKFAMSLAVLVFRSNYFVTMEQKFNTPPSWIGYLISYQAFISTIGSYFVGYIYSFYKDSYKLLFHTSIILTVSILGLTWATNVFWLVFFFTPFNLSTAIARVTLTDLTFKRSDQKEYGIIMGLGQSITSSSRMFSPIISGLAQELSVDGPGYMAILISLTGCLALNFVTKGKFVKTKKS